MEAGYVVSGFSRTATVSRTVTINRKSAAQANTLQAGTRVKDWSAVRTTKLRRPREKPCAFASSERIGVKSGDTLARSTQRHSSAATHHTTTFNFQLSSLNLKPEV